jgi:uncharacterized membrane protein YfcA
MRILLYLGIGLTVGTVSGALGIGGGVLLVPALTWLCGLNYQTAAGTTLAVLVVPVVLPAALVYGTAASRELDLEAAVWIAVPFAVGGWLGATLVVHGGLHTQTLRLCFGLVMIYIAFRFIITSDSEATRALVGLAATVGAWLAYLGLRLLGRRYPRPIDMGARITQTPHDAWREPDYMI